MVKKLIIISDWREGAEDSGCPAVKATKKKQIVSLKKLERAQRIQREGLEKVACDPKSIERFGGIVEYIEIIFPLK